MNEQLELNKSHLTFRLGDDVFAVNASRVLEILEIPHITEVPQSLSFLRGVFNLRGTVLPVISTRAKLGLPEVPTTIDSCVVVLTIHLDGQDTAIGIEVDAVQEVMDIQESDIQPAPTIGCKYKLEFLRGMVKNKDQFVLLLEPDVIFTLDEVLVQS